MHLIIIYLITFVVGVLEEDVVKAGKECDDLKLELSGLAADEAMVNRQTKAGI